MMVIINLFCTCLTEILLIKRAQVFLGRGVDSRAATSCEQLQPFKPRWLSANGFPQDSAAGTKVLFTSMTSRRCAGSHKLWLKSLSPAALHQSTLSFSACTI